ncbi:hypothetical protein [Gemmata sp.]|uniref:hypothetical protein n=1 Tax=Gemmata sp. TaxID=1914242 RepID=UPI003F71B5C2
MTQSTPRRRGRPRKSRTCPDCGSRLIGRRDPVCPACTRYELGPLARPIPYALADRRPEREGGAR